MLLLFICVLLIYSSLELSTIIITSSLANNFKMAIQHYTKALDTNPFSFHALSSLSKLGTPHTKLFDITKAIAYTQVNQDSLLFKSEKKEIKRPLSGKRVKKEDDTTEKVKSVLKIIAKYSIAYSLTCSCDEKAVGEWEKLDQEYYTTAFVLTQIAIAYYHGSNYKKVLMESVIDNLKSACFFQRALLVNPDQLFAMDFYSNVLWHLKDIPNLVYLSRELERHSSEASETLVLYTRSTR